MNFETLDWEAEARRLARAFGVGAECYWEDDGNGFCTLNIRGNASRVIDSDGLGSRRTMLLVQYDRPYHIRQYELYGAGFVMMRFHEEGKFLTSFSAKVGRQYFSQFFARPLFHLELLTPEVETELELEISAHEKVEWAREYAERFGL